MIETDTHETAPAERPLPSYTEMLLADVAAARRRIADHVAQLREKRTALVEQQANELAEIDAQIAHLSEHAEPESTTIRGRMISYLRRNGATPAADLARVLNIEPSAKVYATATDYPKDFTYMKGHKTNGGAARIIGLVNP